MNIVLFLLRVDTVTIKILLEKLYISICVVTMYVEKNKFLLLFTGRKTIKNVFPEGPHYRKYFCTRKSLAF